MVYKFPVQLEVRWDSEDSTVYSVAKIGETEKILERCELAYADNTMVGALKAIMGEWGTVEVSL